MRTRLALALCVVLGVVAVPAASSQQAHGDLVVRKVEKPDIKFRDQHGTHEYDTSEFGLTEDRLAERFGAYRARFDSFLH